MSQNIRFVEARDGQAYKRYDVILDDSSAVQIDLSKKTVWETVRLLIDGDPIAELSPERKLNNRRWQLRGDTGAVIAVDGSSGWIATYSANNELFKLGDPRRWQTKLLETALNSWPDRYVFAKDGIEIGQVARRLRDGATEPTTRLGKLKGLFQPRDWTAEIEAPLTRGQTIVAVAALLLLIEVSVTAARSS